MRSVRYVHLCSCVEDRSAPSDFVQISPVGLGGDSVGSVCPVCVSVCLWVFQGDLYVCRPEGTVQCECGVGVYVWMCLCVCVCVCVCV
jgi:hypothetical protein